LQYRFAGSAFHPDFFIFKADYIMKKYYLPSFFFLLSSFFLTLNAQTVYPSYWECGLEDEEEPSQSSQQPCESGGIWTTLTPYLPDASSVPLVIHVNFIFWTVPGGLEDGTTGNFNPSNVSDMWIVDGVRDEINRRISNLVDPESQVCYQNSEPPYVVDAKIRFDVKYYWIEDGTAWNIENAQNGSAYCPGGWDSEYAGLVDQRLAENNVREGINVFFVNEGTAYQLLVIDTATTDYNGTASLKDCSELSLSNLDQRLRVAMVNEYLGVRFSRDVHPTNWDSLQAVYGIGRILLHELGHSLGLGHIPSTVNCPQNLMTEAFSSQLNYLTSDQIRIMHERLHRRSVRKYVTCESTYNQPRVLTGQHTWAFDTKIYTDIILESGAELLICGNVYMPKLGAIHVKRGAKLIVDGGTISFNRQEYDDCPDQYWAGIFVWGNKDKIHADVDPEDLQEDDPGVVIIQNDAVIEYALNGVNTYRFDLFWLEDYWGGIVIAENSTFLNCGRSVFFMPYKYPNASRFTGCDFISTLGNSNTGVTIWRTNGITFEDCTFLNLGNEGIRSISSRTIVTSGCRFEEMAHGIYALSEMPLTGSLIVGTSNDTLPPNVFTQNTSGIYAIGLNEFFALKNDFTVNNFGIAVHGNSLYRITDNTFSNQTIGINNVQTQTSLKIIDCNQFSNSGYGIRAMGNNRGIVFRDNEFGTTIDLFIGQTSSNNVTIPGAIALSQGALNNVVFNLFTGESNTTDVYALQGQTEPFLYFAPADPPTPRLVPRCGFGGGCATVYNFFNFQTSFGDPGDCLNIPEIHEPCVTKSCLDIIYQEIAELESQIDSGDPAYLMNLLSQFPGDLETYQELLAGSPLLSDEVLTAMMQSQMVQTRKQSVLLANAPLSEMMMEAVEGEIDTATFNALENERIENPVSDREFLEAELALLGSMKDRALYGLASRFISVDSFALAEELLLFDGTKEARRALVSLRLLEGDAAAAAAALDSIPKVEQEDYDFATIMEVNIQLDTTTGPFTLSSTDEARLYEIAESGSAVSGYARGLLALLLDETFIPEYPEEIDPLMGDTGGNASVRLPAVRSASDNIPGPETGIHPNPAEDWLYIRGLENAEGLEIEIFNSLGIRIYTNTLTAGSANRVPVGHLPGGLYWVVLRQGKAVVFSEKLMINH
jgi:hypothetical protein